MSIRIKKIISFIPFVNILVIPFLWFRLYYTKPVEKKNFFRCVLKCMVACVLITIPRIVIFKICGEGIADTITTYIAILLTIFSISYIMVKDEENFIKTQE